MQVERILAIDYGLKRVGLALTDPLLTFAYPYKTLINNERFLSELENLIYEKEVTTILLGIPLDMGQKNVDIRKAILTFKATIEKRFGLPVILRDESYSSELAKKRVLESTPKKSARRNKGLIDKNAAALLLEEYLEEISS